MRQTVIARIPFELESQSCSLGEPEVSIGPLLYPRGAQGDREHDVQTTTAYKYQQTTSCMDEIIASHKALRSLAKPFGAQTQQLAYAGGLPCACSSILCAARQGLQA
jgi:hypothetical protein